MKLFFFVTLTATTLFAASSTLQNGREPFKELQKRAEKEASEKNYKELKDAAAELVQLSKQINAGIDQAGKDAISAHIFERLDRIEKLVKKIREKAKGSPTSHIGGTDTPPWANPRQIPGVTSQEPNFP
jgi:hypothetical protein